MNPTTFQPRYFAKPWGGRVLSTRLGRRLPGGDDHLIGESWEFVPAGEFASEIACRGALPESCRVASAVGRLPQVALKLIDACQDLSLQVHRSKWEGWLILHAEPGSSVVYGTATGVTQQDFARAIARGDRKGIEPLLRRVPLAAGEFLANPSGTLHSIGGGLLLLEVQTPQEETLRVWDWGRLDAHGRAREVQPEAAMSAIDWQRASLPANAPLAGEFNVDAPGFAISLRHDRRWWMRIKSPGAAYDLAVDLGEPLGSNVEVLLIDTDDPLPQ